MKELKYIVLSLLMLTVMSCMAQDLQDGYLYKSVVVRAEPGQHAALKDRLKSDMRAMADNGADSGLIMQHWQGDHWDFHIMMPAGKSYNAYFSSPAAKILERKYGSDYYDLIAWQEEAFVRGPDLADFEKLISDNSYFHFEMFISKGGKQKELYKEREMENVYGLEKGGVYNWIFTRENGYAWDIFTLGGYRDFAHYAEIRMSDADAEAAAKKAGFESSSSIGSYLRTLIMEHNDSLGGKIEY